MAKSETCQRRPRASSSRTLVPWGLSHVGEPLPFEMPYSAGEEEAYAVSPTAAMLTPSS